MAKNYNNGNNGENKNVSQDSAVPETDKYANFRNILPTAFNIAGLAPTASVFRLTSDQIKREVLAVARTFIGEFTDCTLEFNNKTGAVYTYLWLPNNSTHLRDTSTMDGNSAIKKPIFRYSNDIKEFMAKFCRKDNQRTFNDENGMGKAAIEVEIIRFMQIIFDNDGSQYNKQFGGRKMRTDISLTANFRKGDNNKFGAFTFLQIEKKVQSELTQLEPKPKKSYSI